MSYRIWQDRKRGSERDREIEVDRDIDIDIDRERENETDGDDVVEAYAMIFMI